MYRPKLSTKQRIWYYLRDNGEVSGTELESMAEKWGTKASVISRRARELVNAGTIQRRLSNRGTVQYKIRGTYSTETLNKDQANALLRRLVQEENKLL